MERTCGILLHPTSLPSPFGIGDFGTSAYKFVDFLKEAGQHLWQILPLTYPGYGNSPYNAISAFAGNPALIDPVQLMQMGLLDRREVLEVPAFSPNYVEYGPVIEFKNSLLRKAFERFQKDGNQDELKRFMEDNAYWINDFTLFITLKNHFQHLPWNQWDESFHDNKSGETQQLYKTMQKESDYHAFVQFIFYKQWAKLKEYANEKGIRIVGDLPIYVSYDSADVWSHRELYHLDKFGRPEIVAGVPPDYFSETGQLWGNPIYDWETMYKNEYKWWIHRMGHLHKMVDIVRIDHFIGFVRYWAVPFGEATAVNGEWRNGPGKMFFQALMERYPEYPIIAEDLGVVTDEVVELRKRFNFPGMQVLQFMFDDMQWDFEENTVVYTGTHDNDTTRGWFEKLEDENPALYNKVKEYLATDNEHIAHDLIEFAYQTSGLYVIIPLQDLMSLNTSARMNVPGIADGNWEWRYRENMLKLDDARWLKGLQ